MANSRATTPVLVTFPSPSYPSLFQYASLPQHTLSAETLDAAFVSTTNERFAYPGGLYAFQHDLELPVKDAVPLGELWRYKYVLDLDGMAYSARFMAALASDSVPVKSTVYREFWEDWIEPWYVLSLAFCMRRVTHGVFQGCISSPSRVHTQRYTTSTPSSPAQRPQHSQQITSQHGT
jgi:hypothetical protein